MKKESSKFQDFQNEKLSTKQQKAVRGGDGEGDVDPSKTGGGTGNTAEAQSSRIIGIPTPPPEL